MIGPLTQPTRLSSSYRPRTLQLEADLGLMKWTGRTWTVYSSAVASRLIATKNRPESASNPGSSATSPITPEINTAPWYLRSVLSLKKSFYEPTLFPNWKLWGNVIKYQGFKNSSFDGRTSCIIIYANISFPNTPDFIKNQMGTFYLKLPKPALLFAIDRNPPNKPTVFKLNLPKLTAKMVNFTIFEYQGMLFKNLTFYLFWHVSHFNVNLCSLFFQFSQFFSQIGGLRTMKHQEAKNSIFRSFFPK